MSDLPHPQAQRQLGHGGPDSSQSTPQHDNGKLQIRVVPYSPPRISSDGSAPPSSRSASYADSSPLGTPSSLARAHTRGNDKGVRQDRDSGDDQPSQTTPRVSEIARSPSTFTPPPAVSSPADVDSPGSPSLSISPRPLAVRPAKRVISINSDKTFSLVPYSESSVSSRADSFGSTRITSTTPSSSWGRVSSSVFLREERSSSPVTPPLNGGRRFSSSSTPPAPVFPGPTSTLASPWDKEVKGGVGKVEETPDSEGKQPKFMPPSTDYGLPPLHHRQEDAYTQQEYDTPQLSSKASFQTSDSASTLSETTNYKIYGESSPVAPGAPQASLDLPSSSDSNYRVLGESSSDRPHSDPSRPSTDESGPNYVVFGNPSPSCSSLASQRSQSRLRPEFSSESLAVAPLQPSRKKSFGHSGAFKSRSRESLRRGSLTSLGAALTEEATRALLVSSVTIPPQPYPRQHKDYWDASDSSSSLDTPETMDPHPHQWSRPLSTVMSESEEGSLPPSRSISQFSATGRMSSGLQNIHNRNLVSMSSGGIDEHQGASSSPPPPPPPQNDIPERPPPTFTRIAVRDFSASSLPIRDHDEHGDGLADLADLAQLNHRPSRTRLAKSASNSSLDHVPPSSCSNRSMNAFSLPTWAWLYYGSGERRFLLAQGSSDSIRSLYNGPLYNDPPYSEFLSRKPSVERFVSNIRSPRRRPRDVATNCEPEIEPAPLAPGSAGGDGPTTAPSTPHSGRVRHVAHVVKKQTSSIWSAHLWRDRRAEPYSMWDPPSAVWSTPDGFQWRRNQQIILFAVGFPIPFAWMIAAFLPLPPNPQREMKHRGQDLEHDPSQLPHPIEEAQYNSARWWRNLNRAMCVAGLLIIGAVIALAVVGSRPQWGA